LGENTPGAFTVYRVKLEAKERNDKKEPLFLAKNEIIIQFNYRPASQLYSLNICLYIAKSSDQSCFYMLIYLMFLYV